MKQLHILRHTGFWKGPGGLAAAPLLLATIMPLVTHIVPEFLVPSLFRFGYTPDELVLLVILLAGTSAAVSRRLPAWSYTWAVLTVASIVAFLTSFLSTMLFDVIDFRAVTVGWLFTITHLLGGLLVLIFAASRANRGLTHTFFIVSIYLVALALRAFIQESTGVSSAGVIVANSFIVFITALKLVVVLAALAHFLAGDAMIQRSSVYILLVVALLDPILTGWALAIGSAGTGVLVLNAAGILGLQVLARWVYVGMALLLTWGLIILFIKLRKANVINPPDSGEAHAC